MQSKQAFEDGLQKQLDEWNDVVNRLRVKAEKTQGDVRMNLMAEVDKLVEHQQRAETYMQELQQTQTDAWKKMQSDIELTRGQMSQAMDQAWKLFEI